MGHPCSQLGAGENNEPVGRLPTASGRASRFQEQQGLHTGGRCLRWVLRQGLGIIDHIENPVAK